MARGDSESGGTPDYTVYPGFIGTTLVNNTHGVYTDDQIYVEVIAQDPAAIGRAAADLLFRRLDGDRSPPQSQTVPTRMITRGSGEIRP